MNQRKQSIRVNGLFYYLEVARWNMSYECGPPPTENQYPNMKHITVWLIIWLLSGCCLSGNAQDDKDWQKEAWKREHEREKDRAEREREYSKKVAEKQRERLKDQREYEKENDKKENKEDDKKDDKEGDKEEKDKKSKEKYPDRYTPSVSEAKRNANPPTPRSTRRPMPTW